MALKSYTYRGFYINFPASFIEEQINLITSNINSNMAFILLKALNFFLSFF